MFEFIFNGTGTSSALPSIACLTDPESTCPTCPSTLKPEGKKNIRRNTSAILRKRVRRKKSGESAVTGASDDAQPEETEERDVVIVIDIGKTFLSAVLEWFPKYGLRRIDAVLLTHAHADATNGLDDLRSWTLNKSIQEYIDIYLSTACFSEIKRAFPYLVSKGFATGGGDVPEFRWHIIEEHVPFAIGEDAFWVTPIEVDHGRQFPTAVLPQPMPLNTSHCPPEGTNGLATPSALYTGETSDTTPAISIQESEPIPFKCFGFIVNNALLYMSDVSNIPDNEWGVIFNPPAIPWRHSAPQAPKNSEAVTPVLVSEEQVTASGPYKVLVIDVLRPKPYASHFGINEAVQATRRIGAPRNYMIGFSHEMSHDQWNLAGEIIEGKTADDVPPIVQEAVDLVQDGPSVWMRPGFDGLRLWVPEDGDEDQSIVEDGY